MIHTVVLAQGGFGRALAAAAARITGHGEPLEVVELDWEATRSAIRQTLAGLVERYADEGLLILTDVPGGTPFNVASEFVAPGKVAVLAGVNVPMAVRLCCPGCDDKSVDELASWLESKGRASVCRAPGVETGSGGRAGKTDPAEPGRP